ncbi:MAG: glycoside hydrolase family 31 protein [Caldilinea sp.]
MSLNYLHLPFNPIADPAAVVSAGAVRFTVLASRLLRLEYSPTGAFEDRPSQAFWFRKQPVPAFDVRRSDGAIEIETGHLLLRYTEHAHGFTPVSLYVTLKATGTTWCYGDRSWAAGNLQGTTRTLDEVDGWVNLEPGLMARNGYAVVDDSRSLVFDENGWIAARAVPDNLDLYFFGYGHDYVGCLQEFQQVAGPTPLIPRYILGNWWSRYWAYDEAELKGLMEEFREREFPLSVCIVDMDWHTTQTGNRSVGWTGYTWNRELFPDPAGLVAWLHEQGLRTALNLHPADGVHPHEEQYAGMAAAVGIDPATGEPVEFDSVDPRFVEAYFELLHHPQETMGQRETRETEFLQETRFLSGGVDFWWLDWQQGKQSKLQGLDPLWWLNHLHFYDLGRNGVKRPFIFSRWGGLGNHRYPIGFSGDTVVSWASLANQPYFTATAANVGYGWWSHDIGGHMWGVEEAELYLRWVQYGVFSPILRLHSTNNPYQDRRPWGWGPAVEGPARAAMQLRHALIPYIYSMAWRNTAQGIPLVTPLYYTHPEEDDAYACPQAYWFGSELIAAPFTAPTEPDLGLSRQRVWLPDGIWFDFFTGKQVAAGWQTVYGDWSEIPVFAKAGAIVPLGPAVGWGGVENPVELTLHVFPGADGQFTLYEDDGETIAYQRGSYAKTPFTQTWRGDSLTLAIGPVQGDATLTPPLRSYVVKMHAVIDMVEAQLERDNHGQAATTVYNAATQTLTVTIEDVRPDEAVTLTILVLQGELLATADRRADEVRRLLTAFRLGSLVKWQIDTDLPKLLAGEANLARYPLTPGQQQALHHASGK